MAYPAVASDLRKVGIDLELQPMSLADLVNRLIGTKEWDGDAHDFDVDTLPGIDTLRLRTWHSCQNPFPTKWYCNCNDEAQVLINQAATETDLDEWERLVGRVMQIYHDDPPALYLLHEADFEGLNKRVKNYRVEQRHIFYDEITIEK